MCMPPGAARHGENQIWFVRGHACPHPYAACTSPQLDARMVRVTGACGHPTIGGMSVGNHDARLRAAALAGVPY